MLTILYLPLTCTNISIRTLTGSFCFCRATYCLRNSSPMSWLVYVRDSDFVTIGFGRETTASVMYNSTSMAVICVVCCSLVMITMR